MELDELKLAWQTLDRRLDWQHTLALHMLNENRLDKLSHGLRSLAWGQVVQIIAGALLAIWAGSYWFDHRYSLPLLICGLLIHGYGLMFILFAARTLYRIQHIDFAAPVLDIQKQLAMLRLWNIRNGQWFGAVGCFIWIPFALIIWGPGTGAPQFLYWLIGTACVCLALLLALILLPRWAPKAGKHLEDGYAGRSVRRVQARLDEIARFEQE